MGRDTIHSTLSITNTVKIFFENPKQAALPSSQIIQKRGKQEIALQENSQSIELSSEVHGQEADN